MCKVVYARNTKICSIKEDIAQSFIEDNHLQGAAKKSIKKISLGLFYKEDLIGVIQFCSPRTAKKKENYSSELLRLCFKKGVRVVGGASKLIKFYIKNYNPDDFFTYQDSTGENSDVYEHAGMTFVGQGKFKKYLVKDGLTINTARFGKKEIFTIGEVSRRGPDALLGTSLGEVYDENGKRLSNVKIFETLGWHVETTSGDKVYEWFNPNKTYYTYKITATDSDKYYFGVHSLNIGQAKVEDCLNDNYFGSGGRKFQNWKKKHLDNIKKEVIKIYSRKSDAWRDEKVFIGDAWKNDPLCLNAQRGGFFNGIQPQWGRDKKAISLKSCSKHGETLFQGDVCAKCNAQNAISEMYCELHGMTLHQGNACKKCASKTVIRKQNCEIHGMTKHRGNNCCKCSVNSSINLKFCDSHGETKHRGDICIKCFNQKAIVKKNCKIHGLVFHRGDRCCSCHIENSYSIKFCKKHGNCKHFGNSCTKCKTQSFVSFKNCKKHGFTKHQGNVCNKCNSQKSVSEKECSVHGLTKHQGNKCCKCSAKKNVLMKDCPIHNLTKHNGNSCSKCLAHKRNHNAGKHSSSNPLCPICIEKLDKN